MLRDSSSTLTPWIPSIPAAPPCRRGHPPDTTTRSLPWLRDTSSTIRGSRTAGGPDDDPVDPGLQPRPRRAGGADSASTCTGMLSAATISAIMSGAWVPPLPPRPGRPRCRRGPPSSCQRRAMDSGSSEKTVSRRKSPGATERSAPAQVDAGITSMRELPLPGADQHGDSHAAGGEEGRGT